ncbi:hypothetical protein QJS10_CPA01g01881 [Acorus calamus]|uniref:Uncharacterized protein n=1 Tax=Acorus calamus TaxID=4465 RepID=A0AAV9FME5_ACOCL|nr:hypothetical protein QJS10_CPA01g01881 [Acorus calamus]
MGDKEESAELLNKLERAELEVLELKRRRSEDAKANEKVVSIFAAREQSWLKERKSLSVRIQGLLDELQSLEAKNEESVSSLNKVVEVKDMALVEAEKRVVELEEKVRETEKAMEEDREKAKKEAQEKSSELWKHKSALIELISNQRQLESEMGRALQEAEQAKEEFESVFEQKEEMVGMVQKLSDEVVKVRKDSEQKEKILSALLRKSKLDTSEKQMLLKELKASKVRWKQAEVEAEKWKGMCESRQCMKGMKSGYTADRASKSRSEVFSEVMNSVDDDVLNPETLLLEYLEAEGGKENECATPRRKNVDLGDCFEQFSTGGDGELVITTDARHLQDWVCSETEKYASILEERHYAEMEAFTEQMKLKDEKLEAFHWQLLSMELETKRLHSHMRDLDENLSRFREENIRLEALLLDRETELKSLKFQPRFHTKYHQKGSSNCSAGPAVLDPEVLWSEVRIVKKKQKEKAHEQNPTLTSGTHDLGGDSQDGKAIKEIQMVQSAPQCNKNPAEKERNDTGSSQVTGQFKKCSVMGILVPSRELEKRWSPIKEQKYEPALDTQSSIKDAEEEKELGMDMARAQESVEVFNKSFTLKKESSWKMDFHALGISYKIKRLKQQLQEIEKFSGTGTLIEVVGKDNSNHAFDSCVKRKIDEQRHHLKGFLPVMSSLNKQVKRYQSLEEKTDDLCKRIHENEQMKSSRASNTSKTKEHTKMLERFLDETLQLQRYMVATGQKLVEIQSNITCCFVDDTEEITNVSPGTDILPFADSIRTLFKDVQRGLEVRIARIIGDIGGTIACHGISHMRRY